MKKFSFVNTIRSGQPISRREFLFGAMGSAFALALAACAPQGESSKPTPTILSSADSLHDEFGVAVTPYEMITTYNNFYEYSTAKRMVYQLAKEILRSPWEITVGGLVKNPGVYDVDSLKKKFALEDRVYRMRCVEGWSKIVPWQGFPLQKWIELVQPTSEARFVRFETIYAPEKMPGIKEGFFPWPYVEGLTIEEAAHPLTLISTGIDGKDLLPQSGGPLRLVVPWKYGFKSIKSIVRIDFVDKMPESFWMKAGPDEYGFYANVNPAVPHRRWSQSTEILLTETAPRPTRKWNGYDQVASLYPNQEQNIWY